MTIANHKGPKATKTLGETEDRKTLCASLRPLSLCD